MTLDSNKRIAVYGAGAIGSFYGALMARAGYDVTLIARGEHLKQMQAHGLTIFSHALGKVHIPVKAEGTPEGEYDIIFVCVKSQDTEESALRIDGHLAEDGFVVSFQNGVENIDILSRHFGADRVMGASLYVGLSVEPAGTVHHSAKGQIAYGAISPGGEINEAVLNTIFTKAGFQHERVADIRLVQWKKLLWNVAFNPLSALLESTCGKMIADPAILDMMNKMVAEAVCAASHAGVTIPADYAASVTGMVQGLENYKTSMLQDIEKNRKPEVDGILGPVVRYCTKGGGSAPYSDSVLRALTFKYGGWFHYFPRLAADVIVVNGNQFLLIERKNPPHGWAIPGGFVDYGEKVEDAAVRELMEETGIIVTTEEIELLGVYSDPARDFRGHVASAVYVTFTDQVAKAADDAQDAMWYTMDTLPEKIAFDHRQVLEDLKKKYNL